MTKLAVIPSNLQMNHRKILISVITPSDRFHEWLYSCIQSAEASFAATALRFEHLIIADGMSNDDCAKTVKLLEQFPHSRFVSNGVAKSLGPGVARNIGLIEGRGEWVMFLDSDDVVAPNFASEISRTLSPANTHVLVPDVDVIGYNWAWMDDSPSASLVGRRRDLDYLDTKSKTLSRYVRHQMDGSVIYSLFRRKMITDHGLRFAKGLHEDVDFLFRSYLTARTIASLDSAIYRRRSHELQITKRISLEHLDGYFRAWKEVIRAATNSTHSFLEPDIETGKVGMIASRIQEIFRLSTTSTETRQLLTHLAGLVEQHHWNLEQSLSHLNRTTYFAQLVQAFIQIGARSDRNPQDAFERLAGLAAESSGFLSCDDLQDSVFLAPKEVRTCCKRFYVNGVRRGDVVLENIKFMADKPLEFRQIAVAKMRLIRDINQGDTTPCDGCPFLKRKKWKDKVPSNFDYVSLEHHSVCNLRCAYCDETYFGGERPAFSVSSTLRTSETLQLLEDDTLFVWGGGEPLVDPEIDDLLEQLGTLIPGGNHRFLSNATRYSDVVAKLLSAGRASLITSIDAGTEFTFRKVRGRPGLERVIANLQSYASVAGTDRIVLKYIVTDDNSSESEIDSFCSLLSRYGLNRATFQLSSDFKSPSLSAEILSSISYLFQSLVAIGATFVYVDDLIRQRLLSETGEVINSLARRFRCVRTPDRSRPFTLFGAGEMTHLMLRSVGFQSRWRIVGVVDSTMSKIGTQIGTVVIDDPKSLLASEGDILISASQGVIDILQEIRRLGISQDRLIRDLII